MNKEFPLRSTARISMFHPIASPQNRKDSDKGKTNDKPSNIIIERTERVTYDYDKPTNSRFGTTKTHKLVAEAPYERGNPHHHNHFNRLHHITNIKTERPYYSIHPDPTDQLPEFHTDFGLFGKTVRRSLKDEDDDPYHTGNDISDLYDRPHDQKLKYPYTKCYITPEGHQDCKEIIVEKQGEKKYDNNEGHSILSKYISRGHEDKLYVDNYKEKDPDFLLVSKPHLVTEGKVCANNICVTQQLKEHRLPLPVGNDKVIEGEIKKKTKHVFPFKETHSGHLIIDPKLVAFENHKLSVLVANPNKTKLNININSNNDAGEIHAITHPECEKGTNTRIHNKANDIELLMHSPTVPQDPDEIRNFLLNINQDNVNNELPLPEDSSGHRHEESLSLDNQYSNSSHGTVSFMENLHSRIKKAIHPDTYIIIGQKSFPCHSVALQVCSTFFENLKRPRPCIHKVELPEKMVSPHIFPSIMEWMLQTEEGRKSIIGKDNVIAIYIASVYLDIQELQEECLVFIQTSMNPGDPLLMMMWDEVKSKPRCQEMMVVLASKAASLFPELYKSKKFLKLQIDELTMLLSSDEVVINNELQIFDAAIRWLLFDWFNRKVYIPAVMSTVRFGLMTPLNLTQINHCPDTFRERSAKEYNQILTHPEVKALMDVGLAFAILQESYEARPEELKKWLDTSKIEKPRPRLSILKSKITPSPSQPSVMKPREEKAKTALSQEQVKHTAMDENTRNIEKHNIVNSNDDKPKDALSSNTPIDNQNQGPIPHNSKGNWKKALSKTITPANSEEKLLRKPVENFSSSRLAGTFISPEDSSGPAEVQPEPAPTNLQELASNDNTFSPGHADSIPTKTNQELASRSLNDETNEYNPMVSSPNPQSNPVEPHSKPSNRIKPVPNPSQPMQTNPKASYQILNNPMTSNPNQSSPNPIPSRPMTSYHKQTNSKTPNPNASQPMTSRPDLKNGAGNSEKNQSGKQMPNKKAKSKLMQPKYFANSQNSEENKPGSQE